jgi:putative hemolysin
MDPIWIESLGIIFLIVLIGFFSASEVAVLSTRKSRMRELADEGNRKAGMVFGFQSNPGSFFLS